VKTALCTIAFKEKPVEEVLDLAVEHGLDGVEIWGKEPHMGERFDSARVEALRRAIEQRGLDVSACGSYVKPLTDDYDEACQAALDTTEALGANTCRIWSGGGASKDVTDDVYRATVDALKPFCAQAAERDIILAFEFHDNSITDNARGTVQLIRDVGAPNLKCYYQPSRREGADDPYEAAEIVGPYVVNAHCQNYDLETGSRTRVADGFVDYHRVAGILARHGFDGYLEIEFLDEDEKLEALAKDAAFLKELAI